MTENETLVGRESISGGMMNGQREAFEKALAKNPDARFWNTTDAMYWAWQAALTSQSEAQPVMAFAAREVAYEHKIDELTQQLAAANGRVERRTDALRRIVGMTDADNPDSYRCDDGEGCLDTVFATASAALSDFPEAEQPIRDETHDFSDF